MADYSDPPSDAESPTPDAPPTPDAASAPVTSPTPAAPAPSPKRPVYKAWWFWVVAIVLLGALAYAVSLAVDDGSESPNGDSTPAASSEPTSTQPGESTATAPAGPGTTAPGEPAGTTPSEPAAGTESAARAFAPDITAVEGDVGVIEEIIAQMEVAGHKDYKVEDGDNGEKHYIWTFEDGSKLIVVMVPTGTGDELAFERVEIED